MTNPLASSQNQNHRFRNLWIQDSGGLMIHLIDSTTIKNKMLELGLFEQLCKHVKPSISNNAHRNVIIGAGVTFCNNVNRRIKLSIKRKINMN